MFSNDFVERLIEILNSSTSQYILPDYLFRLMRVRKAEYKTPFYGLENEMEYVSGPGEVSPLFFVPSIIEKLRNFQPSNVETNWGAKETASGHYNSTVLNEYYDDKLTCYRVLGSTFGNQDEDSDSFIVGDFYPLFVRAVKMFTGTKPTMKLFHTTLQNCGLFDKHTNTRYQYGVGSSLYELISQAEHNQ